MHFPKKKKEIIYYFYFILNLKAKILKKIKLKNLKNKG
jgi:hypothetical protein